MSWNHDLNSVLNLDRFDKRVYGEVHGVSQRLQEVEEKQGQEFNSFPSLLQDIWGSLYKMKPQLSEEIPASHKLNQRVMEQVLQSSEYRDLHSSTKLDEWSSALAAMSLSESVMDKLPSQLKQVQREMEQAESEMQKFLDLAEAYRDAGDEHSAMEAGMDGESKQGQVDDLSQHMDELFEQGGTKFKQLIRQSLEQTSEQVNKTQQQLSSWGVGRGDGKPVSGKERLELAQRLTRSPKLQHISELAGRMENIALQKQRTKTQYPPSEVTDITLGNDLAHVLPSELMLLRNPATRKEFLHRFAEAKLLQYELIGHETEGKGPIVVLDDNSGSMEGSREIWAKAVTMALFAIARKQKRAFACIHFGDADEIKVYQFPRPDQAPPSDLMEMANFFFNGGTNFEAPLTEGMKVIELSDFQKADLVMITDGDAPISDTFLEQFQVLKKQRETQVITVLLETKKDSTVKKFSDHVVYGYTDHSKNEETLDLLFNI